LIFDHFDFTATIKLILIIANFHCILLLDAALHSIITEMASRFELSIFSQMKYTKINTILHSLVNT